MTYAALNLALGPVKGTIPDADLFVDPTDLLLGMDCF